ncbi:MAG: dihydrodipicolinate synthase family protein [Spirochaetaceae bacterium]|nr:dihydrodipicolinate synthase family protein [Spirochaetaceae bacterium]
MSAYLEGIIVPLLVPGKLDGSFDEQLFAAHVDFLATSGVKGLFVGGTTGEFVNYTDDQRRRMLEIVVRHANGLHILYNITSMCREEMCRHIRHAQKLGVSCVSVTAPYYHKYDKKSLVAYFKQVGTLADGLNLFAYNMPGMTGNPLTPDMVGAICEAAPNLKGIKDSSMNFTTLQEFLLAAPSGFEVVTGNDAEIMASAEVGCKGAIVAMANVYPALCVGIFKCLAEGDKEQAWNYQKRIIKLRFACRSTMPVMSHKFLLELQGRCMGVAHFPMRELTENEKETLRAVATEYGM